jgi:hypothetical protein
MKCVNIENINYKIQELTVQQLSGTLNIGMSALTDPEEVNKWLGAHNTDNELDEATAPPVEPQDDLPM